MVVDLEFEAHALRHSLAVQPCHRILDLEGRESQRHCDEVICAGAGEGETVGTGFHHAPHRAPRVWRGHKRVPFLAHETAALHDWVLAGVEPRAQEGDDGLLAQACGEFLPQRLAVEVRWVEERREAVGRVGHAGVDGLLGHGGECDAAVADVDVPGPRHTVTLPGSKHATCPRDDTRTEVRTRRRGAAHTTTDGARLRWRTK